MSRMNRREAFRGVYSLLLTPFRDSGAIDWNAYERYVEWQCASSPQGLFAVCGSSEMKWLTLEERLALARSAVTLAGPLPVVATANAGPDSDRHEEELLRIVDTGVAAVVLVPPDGLGREPNRLKDYFLRLADASPVPVILYEWPQVHPYEIAPALYRELAATGRVVGIKDTTCTPEGISAKIEAAPDTIVYQANTPFLFDAIRAGAQGIMATISTAASRTVVGFWEAIVNGETRAEEEHRKLVFLDAALRFGYPATAKYLVQLQGIPFPTHCRAGQGMSVEAKKAVDVWMRAYAGSVLQGEPHDRMTGGIL